MLQRATLPQRLRQLRAIRHASSSSSVTLGIRREDPGRLWERRTPITPDAVHELVRDGVHVEVQPCDRRVFTDKEYLSAGATLSPTLSSSHIIVGIKETPLSDLATHSSPLPYNGQIRPRTHLMFSHTAKGQPYNFPLLAKFIEGPTSARLIDYELITGQDGKREVAFGWFAGAAGLVEGLAASALDLLTLGIATPFLHLPRPYANRDIESMRTSLRAVGDHICSQGTPKAAGPFIVGVTGNGKVSNGALDLLKELPCVYIKAEDLQGLVSNPDADLTKVYVLHISSESYLFRTDGSSFSREDYYTNPSAYESRFHETVAPYLSLLINGVGWQRGFPRLMTNEQLTLAVKNARRIGPTRFRSVADVACDVKGGLEFLDHLTTIDSPIYTAHIPSLSDSTPSHSTIQMMSVDILPSELPYDASVHFSSALSPYLRTLIREFETNGKESTAQLDEAENARKESLKRATIAWDGKLMPGHEWLYNELHGANVLPAFASSSVPSSKPASDALPSAIQPAKKRVLLFGSGMVARPFCRTIWDRSRQSGGDIELIIASNNPGEANALVDTDTLYEDARNMTQVVQVGIGAEDESRVSELIKGVDLVVSLLPATLHTSIAKHCLDHSKHLVTASYISPAMNALNDQALEKNVLFLNEIGLDPGLDHLSAMEMRDRMHAAGKRVVSFVSWCGGLPAPEDSNVPLGMKFSWSPKALLSAASNDARFKLDNESFSIPGKALLTSKFENVPILKGFALEGLANRDSTTYASTYGLGPIDSLETMFRGTLRYKGFAELLSSFRELGLFSALDERKIIIDSWPELLRNSLNQQTGVDPEDLRSLDTMQYLLDDLLGKKSLDTTMDALRRLSLLEETGASRSLLPALPTGAHTPLDLFTTLLSHNLRYEPHERDMVILSHELITESSSFGPSSREVHTSTLVTYGDPVLGSAMARTVGIPLAFAALRVLDGDIKVRGVRAPVDKEVYAPVLRDLEGAGIRMREETVAGAKGMASELRQSLQGYKL